MRAKIEPTLENSVCFWANLGCCKWPNIGQTVEASGHTASERRMAGWLVSKKELY